MAVNLNKVFIAGNLTRDPELRYVPSGQAVASFSIAVNRPNFGQSNGTTEREASFFRIVVWGRLAEVCNEYLIKGSSVIIEGRLQSRSWEGQDGQRRTAVEVVASSVQFLSRTKVQESREGEQNSSLNTPQNSSMNSAGGGSDLNDVAAAASDVLSANEEEDVPF